jgi:hypothetical protein
MADGVFTVGPPEAVTDSRQLPAVTPEQEAQHVHGADLGSEHPDNVADVPEYEQLSALEDEGEDLPTEAELAEQIAGIDPNAVDLVGFDDSELS